MLKIPETAGRLASVLGRSLFGLSLRLTFGMAISPSPESSDRDQEPTRSRSESSDAPNSSISEPSDSLRVETPTVQPPKIRKPSRAGFVPISPGSPGSSGSSQPSPRVESTNRSPLIAKPGERVIAVSDSFSAIEPNAPDLSLSSERPDSPASSATPSRDAANALHNPFNADALDFGQAERSEPSREERDECDERDEHEPAIEIDGLDKTDETGETDTADRSNGWRNAGRAERWTRLKSLRAGHLRRRELIATIALCGLISLSVHWLMQRSNDLLLTVGVRPIQAFYLNHNMSLAIALALVAVSAPFLLDLLLRQRYHIQPLTPRRLAKYSPEAAQILTRFANHKRRAKPQLYTVKTPAALVWVYGYGQKSLRLVISTGAIETLSADEIATDVAAGLAAGVQGDVLFATVSVALLQLPYLVYDGFSAIGDWCQGWTQRDRPAELKTELKFDRVSLRVIAAEVGLWLTATIATLAYGIYRLFRLPLLAWSRLRQTYADRFAANLTGNPNARARSLVKQALTQRHDFDRHQALSSLCERFDLLSSVNPRHSLWLGALADTSSALPFDRLDRLGWDAISPHSTWLAIGDAHPALGQRLARLMGLAHRFKLEPEFPPDLFRPDPSLARRPRAPKRNLPIAPASLLASADLMPNVAPLLGIVAAIGLVALAASLGSVGRLMNWRSLAWLQADWPWLTLGLVLEGFAIGTFLRINAFFPDFKPYALKADPDLDRWISDPDSLPIDSRTLRLSGTLIGRRGVGNWFGQDLWLDDGATLWPLHYLDRTGWLGWLLPTHDHVHRHIGKPVTITGWFRRGVTPWIDVDRLEPITKTRETAKTGETRKNGEILEANTDTSPQNGHPLWSTAIASLCAVWGAVLLAKGGF